MYNITKRVIISVHKKNLTIEEKPMNIVHNLRIALILGTIFLFLTSSAPAQEDTSSMQSKEEILLGMSTALTGPTQYLGKNVLSGVLTGIDRANRKGGINGRKIKIIAYDDGYEPKRTTPNMNKLIDEDKVLAIIGNVGTPTAIVSIPIVNNKKVLLFAPYTGAAVLRKTPPDRYVINYSASYAEETSAMIDALMQDANLNIEDIAFFTQRDGYGDTGFEGGVNALKRYGLEDESAVPHVRYERNTLNVEGAVSEILLLDHSPKAILLIGTYAPCAKFIKLIRENGLNPIFTNVSFVGTKPLAENLGPAGDGVIATQVVPHYESDTPIAKEYLEDLVASDLNATPSFGSFKGYVASRILILALENIKGEITRESIIDSMENLNSFDIGLGVDLKITPTEHQASHTIWPTILKDGKFIPFHWKDLKK